MEDDWDDFGDDLIAAVDELVAQHQGKGQQLTQSPDSPHARGQAAAPPVPQHQLPSVHQQHVFQQQQLLPAPLQITPPLLTPGVGAPQPPRANAGASAAAPAALGLANGSAFPVGRVTQAAASLQAHPLVAGATNAAPADLQLQLTQLMQERDRLLEQLRTQEGTNKLLRSNLAEAERERHRLRQQVQQVQQLEARGPAGGQPSFTQMELQKQMETLKQQLLFREQEVSDLKRQQSDKLERLREAEAAVQGLQAQIQGAAQAARSQLEQRSAQDRSQQQQQQQQQHARASGHKRPKGAAGDTSSATPQATRAGSVQPAAAAAAAGAAVQAGAPLLGLPALAAALGLGTGAGLVSRLWAACGQTLPKLLGAAADMPDAAAAGAAGGLNAQGAGPNPTVLLLRLQTKAAAAAVASDAVSSGFCHAFRLQLQQVAAGLLPPATLVDSIAAMAAGLVASWSTAGGGSAAAGAAGAAGSRGSPEVPPQQVALLAAALHVLQHLLELDAGCQQVAAASSLGPDSTAAPAALPPLGLGWAGSAAAVGGMPGLLGRLQLSQRVTLAEPGGRALQQQQQLFGGAALPSLPAPPLPQCHAALQQHSAAFVGKGHGLAAVLVTASAGAARSRPQLLGAALGALCALAAGMPVGGGREALKPALESGAMEAFLRAPGLRAQALRLLHLLLEEPVLLQALEQGLAHAGCGSGQDSETPGSGGGAGAGTGGGASLGPSTDASSGQHKTSNGKDVEARGGGKHGVEPMHIDGAGPQSPPPWAGAPAVLRNVLQSLSLAPAAAAHHSGGRRHAAHAHHHHHHHHHHHQKHAPRQAQRGAGTAAATPAPAAPAGAGASAEARASGGGAAAQLEASSSAIAAARQALRLVALLRELRAVGVLAYLMQSEDGGEGLCQRLMQLIETASAQHGAEAATASLFPAQFPGDPGFGLRAGQGAAAGGAGGSPAEAEAAQLAWQERLRVVQEALTLLRGLLVDDALGGQAMDDLCASPASTRLCLVTLGRLVRLEAPPPQRGPAALPLAPWAQAIGSSSSAPGALVASGGGRGTLVGCSVGDVAYMARSMRHRLMHRLKAAAAAH